MVGGTSGGGTWPVPTFSHRIVYSSPAVVAEMCGACGAVGVFSFVLAAPRPWRLSMSFMS